jgi:outer membrane protein assembly factor BamB
MGCQHADRRLTLTCYDWADGKIVWDLSVPNPEYSSPVLADGKLILLCNKGERLWLVDSQTGKRLADTEVGAKVWTSPAIVNGRLYLRLADDSLACYDLSASANE